MNILLLMPLNEPFDVNADCSSERSKLNRITHIKKVDRVYPAGLLSMAALGQQYFPLEDLA